jgi:hypothetical protein
VVSGQRHAPEALPEGKRHGTQCTGGWVGPRSALEGCGKSRSHRDLIPFLENKRNIIQFIWQISTELSLELFNGQCVHFVVKIYTNQTIHIISPLLTHHCNYISAVYSGTSNFEHNPFQETVRLSSCSSFELIFPMRNNVI